MTNNPVLESKSGGAGEARTPDLCDANAALSQLSYDPEVNPLVSRRQKGDFSTKATLTTLPFLSAPVPASAVNQPSPATKVIGVTAPAPPSAGAGTRHHYETLSTWAERSARDRRLARLVQARAGET